MTPARMAALHVACFTTPRPWSEAEILDLLSLPGTFLELSAQGFLMARVVADEAELLTLAVAPEARRQGTGSDLVGRFLRHAKDRGAVTAFLEVAADNAGAISLYTARGFSQTGRRKGYYHAPDGRSVDALVMSCPL